MGWDDSIIQTDMPDSVNEKQSLFEMVKTFQIHCHSETCRKYRNHKCRFHFGKLFSSRIIVVKPLPDNVPEEIKSQVFKNGKYLLSKVKSYINTELNPSKKYLILQELIIKE